jgi:hypothetical protein
MWYNGGPTGVRYNNPAVMIGGTYYYIDMALSTNKDAYCADLGYSGSASGSGSVSPGTVCARIVSGSWTVVTSNTGYYSQITCN